MQLLLLVLCGWLLYRLCTGWLYSKFSNPLRHLPQLKDDENVSPVKRFFREPSGPQIHHTLQRTSDLSLGLVRSKGILGGDRIIVTSDQALGEILRQPDLYQVPSQRRLIIGHLTGDGLLAASGESHKHQRKNLTSAFAPPNIRNFYTLFWQKATELVTHLSKQPKKEDDSFTVDIHAWAGRLAMDNIGIAAFGTDFGLLANDQTEFSTKYIKAFGANPINGLRVRLAFLLPKWLFLRLPLWTKSEQEASAFIRAKCAECIQQACQVTEDGMKAYSNADTICRVALNSNAFSNHNLEDQLMTILAAGHHTSQSSLTSTIVLLCQHPDVQDRLRAGITQLLSAASPEGGKWNDAIIADLVQLPYLQAICHEALRLFPPVPTIRRRTSSSTTLLGYTIPKDTLVIMSPWIVHRDPLHWGPDADEFRPTRWLDDNDDNHDDDKVGPPESASIQLKARGGAMGKYSFMTFAHGPRNCIGQVFANAELAVSVAALVSSFGLRLSGEVPAWEDETVLKPTGAVGVVLTPMHKS